MFSGISSSKNKMEHGFSEQSGMFGGRDDDVLAGHEHEHGSKLTGQRGDDGRKG